MDHLTCELQRRYDLFIGLNPKQIEYYLGIHDYVDLVLHSPLLLTAIEQDGQSLKDKTHIKSLPVVLEEKGILLKNKKVFSIQQDYSFAQLIFACVEEMKTGRYFHDELNIVKYRIIRDIQRINDHEIVDNNYFLLEWRRIEAAMEKLHRFLLKSIADHYLISGGKEKTEAYPDKRMEFDEAQSVLYVQGHAVKIKKQNKLTMAHRILKHIFVDNADNIAQEFFISEYADKEFNDEPYNSRKYTAACEAIKQKVMLQTGMNDFLTIRNGKKASVRINEKYLVKPDENDS